MEIKVDLRKERIELDVFNEPSPILTIGPISIYLNAAQTWQLTELLKKFYKNKKRGG